IVVLTVIAKKLAVGGLTEVRVGDRRSVDALEIDVDERTELSTGELPEPRADVCRRNRGRGPILDRRVGGEVAAAVPLGTKARALANEDEERQVLRFGLFRQPLHGVEDVLPRGGLAVVFLVLFAEQEADVLRLDAEIVLVGEQIVKGLDVILGMFAGL